MMKRVPEDITYCCEKMMISFQFQNKWMLFTKMSSPSVTAIEIACIQIPCTGQECLRTFRP